MRIYIAAVLLFLLCGCGMPEKRLELSDAAIAELVRDAARVMHAVYPPAKTRLFLQSNRTDAFGNDLLESLRLHGYAVADFVKTGKRGKNESPPDSLPFSAELVLSKADGEARLVLTVGTKSLSRLYAVQETDDGIGLVPKSAWSRQQ